MNMTHKQLLGWASAWLAVLSFLAVLIPGFLVRRGDASQLTIAPSANVSNPDGGGKHLLIPVYLSKTQTIETVPLEDYVRGVVAAEMPADFELEAMKAQAIAARTYIVRRILERDFSNVPVNDAWVTDTITHQAYLSEEELRKRADAASPEAAAGWDKLNRAVRETNDLILTYGGKPIQATFFSTSNGFTENAADYWGDDIPYLRSVASPWDAKLSPRYKETVTIPYKVLIAKLGVKSVATTSGKPTSLKVLSWTDSKRVKSISAGGRTFSGKEFRERLGLNSSQFAWTWRGDQLEMTTTGYGHGVGMSQWGANGMAREGKSAEEIVKYFYQGVAIEPAASYLTTKS
ncbi:stage II sporulation protein D [Paenibacillus chartarius]|uniref:Stage II sporulation protein D n=1 Tax=Paenibacillus chartarius TaxID=747481 RepID=A0ABV6DV22_9BACL